MRKEVRMLFIVRERKREREKKREREHENNLINMIVQLVNVPNPRREDKLWHLDQHSRHEASVNN